MTDDLEILDTLAETYLSGAVGICDAFKEVVATVKVEASEEKWAAHEKGLELAQLILTQSAEALAKDDIRAQLIGKTAMLMRAQDDG